MGKLADTLSQMSDDFLQAVIRQTKVNKLDASGELASAFRIEKTQNGFTLINDKKYAKAVLEAKGVRPNKADARIDTIIEWMKSKGLRPYRKLPNGSTRFLSPTLQNYRIASGAIIRGSIRKMGLIKRYNYKGSNTLKQVVDTKIKKWATDISVAFKEDLITQMKAEISFKDLKI